MPVINGVYLKDFPALPSSVADANIIPIAISGNQIAYRTTVAGIVTDARVTSKLLTGLSVTGSTILATDTILQAFGKVQNQLNGKVSSVGLTMPAAFNVANSPITSAGTLAVTAAGLASQYIRGDGALGDFPTTGGGGSSVSYYLNGSVSQGTIGGNAYYEMNKTPVIGTGTDFSIATDGYIAQFITDANDPASLLIPGGNWNVEMYFSASSSGGTPSFYVEVYKYDGSTFTLLGSSATTPEGITNGTAIDIYYTSVGIPETVLTITDRLAIRVYVTHSGRTITLHTEDNHLSEIVTTFSNGLTALNGLTKQTQYFATGTTGTDFNISSSVDTHTFNIPDASASNRGLITTGTQTIAGAKTFNDNLTVSFGASTVAAIQATTTNASGKALSCLADSTSEPFTVKQLGSGKLATFFRQIAGTPDERVTIFNDGSIYTGGKVAIGTISAGNGGVDSVVVRNSTDTELKIVGTTGTGSAVFSASPTFTGLLTGATATFSGTSGDIIASTATTGKAFRGTATTGYGVYATSTTGQAIYAESTGTGGSAINGTAANGIGGYFINNATSFATLIVTNSGSGNLASFSNSAGTKFTINNAGNLGNGTYTYTLPSATGTLALTSALSSYLPLSGGTLTGRLFIDGNLSGNNIVFAKNAHASGYGLLINGGNSSNYALEVANYLGATILSANTTALTLSVPLSGTSATFTGGLTVNNNSSSSPFELNNTLTSNYLFINSPVGLEAMTRYYNPTAGNWYTGIRGSAGLGSTSSYHIFSSTYGADVAVFNTDGTSKFAGAATFSGIAVAQLFSGENSTSSSAVMQAWNKATSGDNKFVEFYVDSGGGTLRGSIDFLRSATLTRYNTTSDANLKNIIGDSNKQKSIDILNSTKIREFSWKADETNKPQIGVIAQELYETYKGAVSVGSDEELLGTEEYKNWQVDKTAFTFHLIAGFQEHERIIKELKAEIDLLKGEPIIPTDNNLE